jgi:hypothetical protein
MKKSDFALIVAIGIASVLGTWSWLRSEDKETKTANAAVAASATADPGVPQGPKIHRLPDAPIPKNTKFHDAATDKTQDVAGIDANHNGVRDDIEALIQQRYPDPAQQRAVM